MITTDNIKEFDYLYEAMNKCKKNVSYKSNVQSFLLNDIDKLDALSDSLIHNTYKEKPHHKFKIYEPKERDIMSIPFVDRVYQRSLVDNIVYPSMTKSLIYDNVACRYDLGTDFGRQRLKRHMQKAFKKYGFDGYVIQIDIKGYYPNMSHKAVENKFHKHLDDNTFKLVKSILDNFEGDYGYHAGSQLIQIAGICLPDEIDHYAKERLHIKEYIRYQDDTIIMAPNRKTAEYWLAELEKQYATIECSFNLQKTKITSLKKKITFLGFDFQLTETGKIIQIIHRKKLKRKKIKYNKMLKRIYYPALNKKEMTSEKFTECLTSFLAHLKKGDSFNTRKEFHQYIIERNNKYYE